MKNYIKEVSSGTVELSQAIAELNDLLEKEGEKQKLTDAEMIEYYRQEEALCGLIPSGIKKKEYMNKQGYRMMEVDGLKLWVS